MMKKIIKTGVLVILIIGIQCCTNKTQTDEKLNLISNDNEFNLSKNIWNQSKKEKCYDNDSIEEIVTRTTRNINPGISSLLLEQKLEEVLYRDQVYRDSINLPAANAEKRHFYWRKTHKSDEINERIILIMLEKIGWPDTRKMSEKASMSIWMVIIHSTDIDFNKKVLRYLNVAFRKDSVITNQVYATTMDRVFNVLGKETLYGTGIFFDKKRYQKSFIDKINEQRGLIGLSKL